MSKQTKAYLAITTYTVILGLSFLFSKIALQEGTTLDILAHRFTFSFIAMIPIIYHHSKKAKLTLTTFKELLPLAFFSPLAFFLLQIIGLQYASTYEAGIIQSLAPIFVLGIAFFVLKEKTTIRKIIYTLCSVFGIILLFIFQGTSFNSSHGLGIILLLFSTISFSIFSVLINKATKKHSFITITIVLNIIGFLCFNFLALSYHFYSNTVASFFVPLTNSSYVFAIFYLGVLSTLITSLCSNYAFSIISASKLSVFGNVATLITILAGALILKESISIMQMFSMLIVLFGVIMTNRKSAQ